jgi:hypothetical protein
MNYKIHPRNLWIFPLVIVSVAVTAALIRVEGIHSYALSHFYPWEKFFWAAAFGWSTFLALYAFQLHNRFFADNPDEVLKGWGKLRGAQRIHQLTLHFSAGMVGWVIVYLFLYTNILAPFERWEKLALILIAYLAIMGYLPYILIIRSWFPRN